jgi:hypothetical protein
MFEPPRRAPWSRSGSPGIRSRGQEDLRGVPTRGRFADEGSIDRKGGDGGIDIESGMVGNYVLGGSTAWRGECRRRGKTCPLTRIEKGRDSQCFCFVVEGQEPNQKHLYRDRSKVRFREFPVPAIPFSVCSHSLPAAPAGKNEKTLRVNGAEARGFPLPCGEDQAGSP